MARTPKEKRVVLSPAQELRASILEAVDLYERLEDVPEWGCKILLRSPTAMDRYEWLVWLWANEDELGKDSAREQAAKNALSLILVACHPDTGEKLFKPDDVWMLLQKSASVVNRLVNAASLTMLSATQEGVRPGEALVVGVPGPEISDAAGVEVGEDVARTVNDDAGG